MPFTRRAAPLLGLATLALGAAPAAHAQTTVYSTGFEAPAFTVGQPVSGQNGWGDDGFSPGSVFVTDAHPSSGTQAIVANGAYLTYYADDGLYIGRADPSLSIDGNADKIVTTSVQARLSGPQTGPPIAGDDFSANLDVYNGEDLLGEIYLSSDGHAYSDTSDTFYVFPQTVTPGQYYTLGLRLDFTTLTTSYFLNGQFLGSLAMPASAATDKEIDTVLSAYGVSDGPGYDHSDYSAFFDNFSVTAAPEPSAFAGLALGALGLGGLSLRARRRAA